MHHVGFAFFDPVVLPEPVTIPATVTVTVTGLSLYYAWVASR